MRGNKSGVSRKIFRNQQVRETGFRDPRVDIIHALHLYFWL